MFNYQTNIEISDRTPVIKNLPNEYTLVKRQSTVGISDLIGKPKLNPEVN